MEKRNRIKGKIDKKKEKNLIKCEAENSGTIYLHKKIFLFGKELNNINCESRLDMKDINDLNNICSLGINIISSQINNENTIYELRDILGETKIKLFARIETSEAFLNFDTIIDKCDGIIIDHGFISTKIPYEDVCNEIK